MPHDNRPEPIDSYPRLVERLVAPGEDPRQFKELYDQLCAEWKPQGTTEWMTFRMIISSRWSVRRLDAMEAFIFETIGRIVWDEKPQRSIGEALGTATRKAREALSRIARMRIIGEKTLAHAERSLRKTQELHRRTPKPARASGPKLADLEPGSNLIQ